MPTGAQLLAIRESAVRPGGVRDHALLGDRPRSLPERNRLALQRHVELFGARLELVGRCPQCATEVEFTVDAAHCAEALARDAGVDTTGWHALPGAGTATRFRLPRPEDLHALSAIDDADAFADALLDRCVEGGCPCRACRRTGPSPRQPESSPRRTPGSILLPGFAHAVAFTRPEAWKMDPGVRRDDDRMWRSSWRWLPEARCARVDYAPRSPPRLAFLAPARALRNPSSFSLSFSSIPRSTGW